MQSNATDEMVTAMNRFRDEVLARGPTAPTSFFDAASSGAFGEFA
jgi:hypothetical protein